MMIRTCPFCGADAELKKILYFSVRCTTKTCPAHFTRSYKTKEIAVKYWNKRCGEEWMDK